MNHNKHDHCHCSECSPGGEEGQRLLALKTYHAAITDFLQSVNEGGDNYICGIHELRVRDAWSEAERLLK